MKSPRDRPLPEAYWSLKAVAIEGTRNHLNAPHEARCTRVETCLLDVVKSQMLSDVPLGCFLSGGINSSLIAALMQKVAAQPVRTFSVGFEDARFNEAEHARRVALHLGTAHTEFIVTEANALAVIAELPVIYDEPFADASQIPAILLSRLTRQHVSVALSGDGGDEVFGGYNRYTFGPGLWRLAGAIPGPGRRAAGRAAMALQGFGTSETSMLRAAAHRLGLPVTTIDKLSRFGGAVGRAEDFAGLYLELVSTCWNPSSVLLEETEEARPLSLERHGDRMLSHEEWMMAMDALTYLPGDILVKVDRAAMSTSLETRAPFLDRRVVELAWQLPLGAKIRGRTRKEVLRDILFSHVPRELLERPKQGFAIPLDCWLRGDLRDWAADLLSPVRLAETGIFNARSVGGLWHDHQIRKNNFGMQIWAVLMMQSWLLHYKQANAAMPLEV